MRTVLVAVAFSLLASLAGSSAHAMPGPFLSNEARVVRALAGQNVKVPIDKVRVFGLGAWAPGQPATKLWSVMVNGQRYSGKITSDQYDIRRVTIFPQRR